MRLTTVLSLGVLVGILSAPLPARAADAGYALKFDGTSDFVTLAANAAILGANWQTTKTVALWVNPTGTSACTAPDPATCDALVGDRPRTWGVSRGVIGGQDRLWIWNYDGSPDVIGVAYTPGVWTHIALVHGGGLLRAYKDGALVGSVASGPTVAAAAQSLLHFGGMVTNAARNWTFEGEIDEVQIWNTALSAAAIVQAMNDNLTGTEPGLAAYYMMSNGSGTIVTDNSGHGWTGTLHDGGNGVPADGPITWVPSGAFGAGGGSPSNTPPVANPQGLLTTEDTPLGITLTGSDADSDPLTFRVTSQPAHGTLSGSAPNLTYSPNAHYHGPDSFTFVANDGWTDSAPAAVSLFVTPVNDAPVAVTDVVQTGFDTPIVISVLSNDFDVDGDPLVIHAVGGPAHGAAVATLTQITYTPHPGFSGPDSFSYTITDNQGGFSTAQVQVTVRPPGADPGLALRFDGQSDLVKLATTANILAPGWQDTKTVELWVKPTGVPFCNVPSPASCDAIFGDRPRWWGVSQGVVAGVDRIWVWNYDGQLAAIGVPYQTGEWMHLAMVHAGGTLAAYKNGVLVGSIASGTTLQPNTGALPILYVGGIINNAERNWTFGGELDEVRIWNTARTGAEIAASMSAPLAGTETGLAAYYSMSNGAGLLVTDDSGHGWTGTIEDGSSGVPPDGPALWVPSGAFTLP